MKGVVIATALALLLSACARDISPEAVGPYPSNFKSIVAEYVRQTYFEPYSL